nr:immunoglobulin heavy chain junction region [Mus musculus]MBK4198132.1 immunoglobulin heavy chain junction region [Mus musculus]MBK4198133.1 immunoglobulin heavy chain junction region [Mus musculus]MBK4198134.1 immunoglobulin heavy chain junction region [Mus musculus]
CARCDGLHWYFDVW